MVVATVTKRVRSEQYDSAARSSKKHKQQQRSDDECSLLASVLVVTRAFPAIAALRHIVRAVDALLDCSHHKTLAYAAVANDVKLAQRLLTAATTANAVSRGSCAPRSIPSKYRATAAALPRQSQARLPFFLRMHITKAAAIAASRSHSAILKCLQSADAKAWLHASRNEGCTAAAMDQAARGGHLEVLKSLHHSRTRGCATNAMDNAASCGHLAVVKWLHENRSEGCTTQAMNRAAKNGHWQMLEFLCVHRTEGCTDDAIFDVAMLGDAELLHWLFERYRAIFDVDAVRSVGESMNHEIVARWLAEVVENEAASAEVETSEEAHSWRGRESSIFLAALLAQPCSVPASNPAATSFRSVISGLPRASHKLKMSAEETAVQEIAAVAPLPHQITSQQVNPPKASVVYTPVDQAASQAGSKITESIAFLERVGQIEIKKVIKRNGCTSYVMEMYLRKEDAAAANKPLDPVTVHVNPLAGKQLESNYQVDHRFSDFAELRRMLQYISHLQGGKAHANQCKYCKEMLSFMEHSIWQPSFWTRLVTTQNMRKDMLTKFMRKIVELAVTHREIRAPVCPVRVQPLHDLEIATYNH